jgi:hypothetical protein
MLIGEDRAGNAVGIDPHNRTLTAIVVDAWRDRRRRALPGLR